MSCSCAGFVWLGFRVLSTVLSMELCLHCLKRCQTSCAGSILSVKLWFKKKKKERDFIYISIYLISDEGHQMENGNVL